MRATRLSAKARKARRPPPPGSLVGALQDPVHRDVGRSRPAKAWRVAAVALAVASCGWPDNVLCTTDSGVELAREPAPAVDCDALEQWTGEVAAAFTLSACPEVAACDVRALLLRGHSNGSGVRLYWRDPPRCWGRLMQAASESAYKHELTHALVDGAKLAPWPMGGPADLDNTHHRLMCRCLPKLAGEALCQRIGR